MSVTVPGILQSAKQTELLIENTVRLYFIGREDQYFMAHWIIRMKSEQSENNLRTARKHISGTLV